ncbi:MAG: molybdopterin-dependent oxidoreductase [Bacteroidales bacterium]
MEEYVTACPRNCYSTCSFRVQVENNRIVRILPYSDNLATPEGPCIKGLSYIERMHSPERIIYPMKRMSSGGFKKISRKEAFDIITDKIGSVIEKWGSKSIIWYRGSGMSGLTNEIGYSFWKALGGATITYGNLCWPAGLEAVRLTLGSVKHNVPWDLENAKTIIIWGKNPAETNIQEIAFIARAKEKGCRIIVIDPLRTPTADKSDMLISPKPGTDGALALAVARILIDKKLIDNDFIVKHVKGFDELQRSLNISASDAELITGIPEENIVGLAGIIGKKGPLTIIPGYGLQRHTNGGQTIRSILLLAVLTGNIGKSGSGFNYANLQSSIFDDIKEPLSYYPDYEKDMPFRRTISMATLGSDMLNTHDPELKAAWIERGNPLLQSPDTNNVNKAFSNLLFKVVVEQFMTDTAILADIILPAKDMFEQSDIVGSYWSPYVQFKPKVIQSPGEVLPESEIYFHLAKRLNLNISNEILPEPGNDNIEKWLEKRISGYSGITLDQLKESPVLAPGLQLIAFEDLKFETPSGKIEIFSSEAALKWGVSALPDYSGIFQTQEEFKFLLLLLTPNTGSRIHSQFGNLKIIKETNPEPVIRISDIDARRRNIRNGQRIKLFNQSGELISRVEISNRVSAGLVVLSNGIWFNEGGGSNRLIAGKETDMGYGAAYHDNRVEIEGVD